MAEERCRYRK